MNMQKHSNIWKQDVHYSVHIRRLVQVARYTPMWLVHLVHYVLVACCFPHEHHKLEMLSEVSQQPGSSLKKPVWQAAGDWSGMYRQVCESALERARELAVPPSCNASKACLNTPVIRAVNQTGETGCCQGEASWSQSAGTGRDGDPC